MFIDEITFEVKSGRGGDGLRHFQRTRRNPKGGPDGGNGGRGGHIILRASHHLHTLYDMHSRPMLKAGAGEAGQANRKKGKDAQDIWVEVPVGTIARKADTGELLCELQEHDQTFILARGGQGGVGNEAFKSSQVRAPEKFTPGEPGVREKIHLELKLLADCGLVGFPNAGKSSLVRALSNATPKVGDYPFTTLKPSLGIVALGPGKNFSIADIPGIIEGAAEGKGLGNQFLRHIERTAVLAFVLTANSEDLLGDYQKLLGELSKYQDELLARPRIILINKSDVSRPELPEGFGQETAPVLRVSAKTREGLEELKTALWRLMPGAETETNTW